MRGFNKVIISGNLARDPEMRYTRDKKAWARFSVAVNRQWKDRNGEVQKAADFIPVVVWGAQADNCERYLHKGSPVLVEGRLQVRSYDDKTGARRYMTDVLAQGVTFLGSGGNGGDNGHYQDQGGDSGDMGSIRDHGFGGDDFPMDLPVDDADDGPDADIPF